MYEIGQVVMKIAGRDGGKKGVIIEIIDDSFVVIDGETRRKRVNIKHIEPLNQKINIKPKAERAEVIKAFSKLGIDIKESKPKQKTERPKKTRIVKKIVGEESSKKAKNKK